MTQGGQEPKGQEWNRLNFEYIGPSFEDMGKFLNFFKPQCLYLN